MAAFDRRDLSKGAAVQTTLNGGISSGATSGVLTAVTGWPDGSPGAFYVVVDPGLTTEEKILCSTRSSTTLNFTTRGADGTSAAAHASGAVIYPCLAAVDLDEANLAVAKLLKLATAVGQIPVVDAANSFAMVQAKTSGQVLVGSGTTLASVAVSGDAILAASGALTVANSAITTAKINDAAVTNAKLAALARGSVKVGNSSNVASDLAVGTNGQVLTTNGTDVSWGAKSGYIASAVVTSGQGVVASSFTDLTSLTVTFTAIAAVQYKISFHIGSMSFSTACTVDVAALRGATFIGGATLIVADATTRYPASCPVILDTPGAGSVTYKLQLRTSAGTTTTVANSTLPATLLVESLG